jgi:hypothetical protein
MKNLNLARLRPVALAWTMAAAIAGGSNSLAQSNIAPIFNAAGATSTFNSLALAARVSNPGGTSGVCGDHNWTLKKGATAIDGRSASITSITGDVWIVWNDTPEPNRTVCAYVSVDAVSAVRLFLAVPKATLSLPSSDSGAAGSNLVPLLPPDEVLPQSVYNDLNNQPFNAAPTGIRPEDALFAVNRALNPLNTTNYSGLGYGPGPIGTPVLSTYSTKSSQPVSFALKGSDPVTGQTQGPWTTTNVGAAVFLVVVNSTDTSSAGLGNSAFNNVDRFVLSRVLDGSLTRTRDLIPSTGLAAVPLNVITREPLSGAYNVVEFTVPRSVEVNLTQEEGVNPANPNNNPLDLVAADAPPARALSARAKRSVNSAW